MAADIGPLCSKICSLAFNIMSARRWYTGVVSKAFAMCNRMDLSPPFLFASPLMSSKAAMSSAFGE